MYPWGRCDFSLDISLDISLTHQQIDRTFLCHMPLTSNRKLTSDQCFFLNRNFRLGHPENYLFPLSKTIFSRSKYPRNILFNFESRSAGERRRGAWVGTSLQQSRLAQSHGYQRCTAMFSLLQSTTCGIQSIEPRWSIPGICLWRSRVSYTTASITKCWTTSLISTGTTISIPPFVRRGVMFPVHRVRMASSHPLPKSLICLTGWVTLRCSGICIAQFAGCFVLNLDLMLLLCKTEPKWGAQYWMSWCKCREHTDVALARSIDYWPLVNPECMS